MIFPYRFNSDNKSFPVVPVRLSYRDITRDFSALIDSGAAISIFRAEVAESLGIKVEAGKKIYLGGVGGGIKGYIHEIEVEVVDKKFKFPVVFSREFLVSFNLLGREGFFDKFQIIFEESQRQVQLNSILNIATENKK